MSCGLIFFVLPLLENHVSRTGVVRSVKRFLCLFMRLFAATLFSLSSAVVASRAISQVLLFVPLKKKKISRLQLYQSVQILKAAQSWM